ncbi:MAG: mechanosensitive ion channel family protein [Chitinophagaceae bacterium]
MNTEIILDKILLPLGIALFVGIALKFILTKILARLSKKTKWKSDDLIVDVFKRWIIFWCLLIAILSFIDQLGIAEKQFWWIENTLKAIFIFTISMALSKIFGGMTKISASQKDSAIPESSILSNIVIFITYVIGLIFILQEYDIKITPILTALGVGGLAVALALQETLSNLFAGIQILSSGKTNIGDFIELENGKKGFIRDITWRNTTIETFSNNIVVIPNQKLNSSIIENFDIQNNYITNYIEVGVAYTSNLEHVETVCKDIVQNIMQKTEGAVADYKPSIVFTNFGDSSIQVRVYYQVISYSNNLPIRSLLVKNIHSRFAQEGIEIPFPIRTIIQHT